MLTNIISFLLEWITLNTHYDASIFNFEVIELSKSELQALACGGKCGPLGPRWNFTNNIGP